MVDRAFIHNIFANLVSDLLWFGIVSVVAAGVAVTGFVFGGWTSWLAGFIAGGLVVLIGLIAPALVHARKETPHSRKATGNEAMRVLAEYYMRLALLKDHVRQMIEVEQLTEPPVHNFDFYPYEVALEKLQRELINMSPALFKTAMAMDLQAPPKSKNYVDVRQRLPPAIDQLMEKVLSHWHGYKDEILGKAI